MKIEAHELALFQSINFRQIVGAATSGSTRIVKAFGKLASSKKSNPKGSPSLSLNKRLLATIKEPHIEEYSNDCLAEIFHAPSLTLSINETACSAKPPRCPRRQVSMDLCATKENHLVIENVGDTDVSKSQSGELSSDSFDRFIDETVPCDKAPPSKPFKRASMEHGFRDSMTSTISAMTLSSYLDESFQSDEFYVDLDDK